MSAVYSREPKIKYIAMTDNLVLDKLEKWQDLNFGPLIYRSTSSQRGIVEKWSICAGYKALVQKETC